LDPSQRRKLVFADLPGYGYAKISKSISGRLAGFYRALPGHSLDAQAVRLPGGLQCAAQESDRQLIDWLRAAGREFAVVATKIDRLSGNQRTRNLLALKTDLELDELLPVSAKTGYG